MADLKAQVSSANESNAKLLAKIGAMKPTELKDLSASTLDKMKLAFPEAVRELGRMLAKHKPLYIRSTLC